MTTLKLLITLAIVVLTPTPDHIEPVIQALRLGYPVICEKALTNSSADALLIQQEQAEQNGFLAVTYNYTGYPMSPPHVPSPWGEG